MNMALPKQVQAQLDEAEELEKSMQAREQAPEDAEQGENPDPDAETQGNDTAGDEPPNTAEPEGGEPADTSPTDVADDFRQKYNTLRGKYDAEVPRLHEQVRELTQQLQSVQAQVEESKRKDEPTKPEEKVSFVTDADREEFGDELLDVQRRVAREVASEYEQQLKSQSDVIEELRAQVAQTGSQVGEMNFSQRLNALVPDFPQIDTDERWVAWLNEYDPMLRAPRRVQAKAAFDAGDAEAVAHYVDLFKQSIADTTQPEANKRQAELEKQVAPSRSANSTRTQSSGKDAKIYSDREAKGIWDKIRVLNTRGKYDDAAKLEADVTAAYLEGRVKT